MSKDCNIVKDILPLYVDEVCSTESREFVENHIKECDDCKNYLEKVKSSERIDSLKEESNDVVMRHAKKEKRTSMVAGSIVAGSLMIPVLVCMIVNLATGHGLSWFFIVLTALMVVASVSVVPLMVYRNKFLWTLGSFTASLLVMLLTICILSHGRWFFIVESAVLLGLSVIFMPAVAHCVDDGFFGKNKALAVIGTDTFLLLNLLFTIGLHTRSRLFWSLAGCITGVVLVFVWVILWIVRYTNLNKRSKAGLIVMWSGLFAACGENIVMTVLGYTVVWHAFRPFTWNFMTVNANVHWIESIVTFAIGICLLIAGVRKSINSKRESNEE